MMKNLTVVLFLSLSILFPSLLQADPPLRFGPPFKLTSSFDHPYGLAVDETNDRLLVADTGGRLFKWVDLSLATGTYRFTARSGSPVHTDPDAFTGLQAIAVDGMGNVYIINTLVGNARLFRFSSSTYTLDRNFVNTNPRNVSGALIAKPRDIAVDSTGAVYLLDSGNNRILKADGPDDTTWSVFHVDSSWKNPYGLDVSSDGVVYVADTGNHRIVKVAGGVSTFFGSWGEDRGEFKFPRDVAVDKYGRMFVADTFNHRIQILSPDGSPQLRMGRAPSIKFVQKIEIDSQDRLFWVDSDDQSITAFLGPDYIAPFDPWIRDYVGDPGEEHSGAFFRMSSPDILVRHRPDIDLESSVGTGLEAHPFQPVLYGANNYVYVAVHNRGTQPAADTFLRLYWSTGTAGSRSDILTDWNDSGFYISYGDETHNRPSNSIAVPLIRPGGTVVVGPLIWRSPPPESSARGDGQFLFSVHIVNPFDIPPRELGTLARESNNITEREVVVYRGAFPIGEQDTLVTQVHFSDLMTRTSSVTVRERAEQMAQWILETSWGETQIDVVHRGPVTPPHPLSYYADPSNHVLVELAQDVLDQLLRAEPDLLNIDGRNITRLVLVTNELESTKDWATTGNWPYTVLGERRFMSISIQGGNNPAHQYSHGMSHQLGLVDLYAHEGAVFSRPYADGWDNMALPMNGVHPLIWSKEHAYWVTSHGSRILWVPRPRDGATWNNGGRSITLRDQTAARDGDIVGIAFGQTPGITAFNEETAFYYAEARSNTGEMAGADRALPQSGVILYYANSQIPQGEGPVIMVDHRAGGDLTDAVIPVGSSQFVPGPRITLDVRSREENAYEVQASYNPPETGYDVHIHQGEFIGTSPDIWVDNEIDGFDQDEGRFIEDRGDSAIVERPNRLYARVFNGGPAEAFDVEVAFFLSDPYHTIDDEGSFDEFRSVFIDRLPEGSTTAFVTWTPGPRENPHTCLRVEMRRLFNDTNASNNSAQQNLVVTTSTHDSPYTPVEFPFYVRNTTSTAELIYFRVDNIPSGWTWSVTPEKALVAPGDTVVGRLRLEPHNSAPDCTSHKIQVTGWTPRGDTLIRLGASVVQVDLKRNTEINLELEPGTCKLGDIPGNVPTVLTHLADFSNRPCARIQSKGCTNPPRPNQEIVLRYTGPDGEPVYRTVVTDARGCFDDFYVVTEGEDWEVVADYPGSVCEGPAAAPNTISIPLPRREHPENPLPDGQKRLCMTGLSFNLEGQADAMQAEDAKASCKTKGYEHSAKIVVKNSGWTQSHGLEGEIEIKNLRHLISLESKPISGLHQGQFTWAGKDMDIMGRVIGVTNLGTRHKPVQKSSLKEASTLNNHWELSLEGTVVKGQNLGARLRAVVAIDLSSGQLSAGPLTNLTHGFESRTLPLLKGTLEGVLEKDCALSPQKIKFRVDKAIQEANRNFGPCNDFPCLKRISKSSKKGQIILDQHGKETCKETGCKTYKTWSRLVTKLRSHSREEGRPSALSDGTLTVASLLQVMDKEKGRGVHGGKFKFKDKKGRVVEGSMLGVSRPGTHRKPLRLEVEESGEKQQLEGRLWGIITKGAGNGTKVEARYVIKIEKGEGRRQELSMVIEGWVINGCLEKQIAAPPLKENDSSFLTDLLKKLPKEYFRPLSKIPKKALKLFKKSLGRKFTPEDARQVRMLDRNFKDLDKDKNKKLDFKEFLILYQPQQPQDNLRNIKNSTNIYLMLLDANKNGEVSKKEVGEKWQILEPLDSDKNSRLTLKELETAPMHFSKQAFGNADENKDQSLSLAEFIIWRRALDKR